MKYLSTENIDLAMDGFLRTDMQGRILEANEAYCQMSGYSKQELLYMSLFDLAAETTPQEIGKRLQLIVKQGADRFEARQYRKQGEIFPLEINARYTSADGGGFIYFLRDSSKSLQITAINRSLLHLAQFSLEHPLDELLEETLNEAETLTGSRIGFYHFVDDDQQSLTLQNWSRRTKEFFCTAEGTGKHYPIAEAGVWVDCVHQRKPVIHNDYASLEHRKGLPDGHAVVIRELVVPVMRDGKIAAILGVGNKGRDYTEQDIEAVQLLANLAWEIALRALATEELQRNKERLDFLLSSSPAVIYACRPAGDYGTTFISDNLRELFGYEPKDFIENSDFWQRNIHPDDAPDVLAARPRLLEQNALRLEYRFRFKDGGYRWVKDKSRLVRDRQGAPAEVIGYWVDISDQKTDIP